ncbi:hypothetical protein QLY92_21340, partial [Cronobacter dublinensis]|uniref:hypothetical protein n=1 Tax=Cronobacter dublinensis TaxID=413497 RepID=UPI0024AF4102
MVLLVAFVEIQQRAERTAAVQQRLAHDDRDGYLLQQYRHRHAQNNIQPREQPGDKGVVFIDARARLRHRHFAKAS